MSLQGRALLRAGRWMANTKLNPARWVEGLGHQLGFRTREKVMPRLLKAAIEPKAAVGEPTILSLNGGNIPNPAYIPEVAGKAAEYGDAVPYLSRPLNGLGMTLQGVGYAGLAGGAGTLGYSMMKGDGTEPAKDANGVKNPKFNEEMAKFRSKFQQEKLGGDRLFSAPKYRALRQQGQWVDTAIQQIGKDNYLQLKQQLADGKLEGGAAKMHSILTDALAEIGDEEMLKQAGTQAYVLPGLASNGKSKRVIVMAPMKGKNGSETTMQALQYGLHEEQQPEQGQQ